ncbi:hypothetical protein BDR26DRAFT_821596 [Obelidium mucronatum]|nr:hypothetical protein BDR26DRAFT_821596 [Obelidium mucronatum]
MQWCPKSQLRWRNCKRETTQDLVFPAISEKLEDYQKLMRTKFDTSDKVKKGRFQVGAYVMVLLDVRGSKLEPRYEGPYRVVQASREGKYQLLDRDEFSPTAAIKSVSRTTKKRKTG